MADKTVRVEVLRNCFGANGQQLKKGATELVPFETARQLRGEGAVRFVSDDPQPAEVAPEPERRTRRRSSAKPKPETAEGSD